MPPMRTIEPSSPQPPNLGEGKSFDLDEFIPIELIRQHTKTDDIPSTTDEMLNIYRQAAIESAEQYTGLVIGGSKSITEIVSIAFTQRSFTRGYVVHDLEHPSMDGLVYLYGYGDTQLIRIKPRTHKIRIPIMAATLDLSSACCRDTGAENLGKPYSSDTYVLYRTGFNKFSDIPVGIILGCYKYVAWCVTHPGDEILAVRNRTITRSSLVDGTNNVAWASGALELWRQYDPGAM